MASSSSSSEGSSFFEILAKFRDKTIFDQSLLEVDKILPYGVYAEDENKELEIKQALDQLINNLAIESIIPFISKVYENISLGKKLNSLHPLTTFEYFYSTSEKKKKVFFIYSQKRAQTSFINPYGWVFAYLQEESIKGYASFVKKCHEQNDLFSHLDSFSTKTGLDKKRLIEIISDEKNENRFTEFVKFIFKNPVLNAE